MPAVGDLRNRLIALAEQEAQTNREFLAVLRYRLPDTGDCASLLEELHSLRLGQHDMSRQLPGALKQVLQSQLSYFLSVVPETFDWRGACIGNLLLCAAYLKEDRSMTRALKWFTQLLGVAGHVIPVTLESCHLMVTLEDGREIIGEHRLSEEGPKVWGSPIQRVQLSESLQFYQPVVPGILPRLRPLLQESDLICYPPGSFFSSVIANLLTEPVPELIRHSPVPKVFVPNLGRDPEQEGLTLMACIELLISHMQRFSAHSEDGGRGFITHLLLDQDPGRYSGTLDYERLSALGIEVVRAAIADPQVPGQHSAEGLGQILMTLARRKD